MRDTIKVARTAYGRVLVDGSGRALYLFTRDRSSSSSCYSACASAWPPYTIRGAVRSRAGARAGLVSSTHRSGGAVQAAYAGHPLYYYVGDRRPGEILCQNVREFGGTWLVVAASGRAVR